MASGGQGFQRDAVCSKAPPKRSRRPRPQPLPLAHPIPVTLSRYGLDALAQFLIDDPDGAVDFGIGHAELM